MVAFPGMPVDERYGEKRLNHRLRCVEVLAERLRTRVRLPAPPPFNHQTQSSPRVEAAGRSHQRSPRRFYEFDLHGRVLRDRPSRRERQGAISSVGGSSLNEPRDHHRDDAQTLQPRDRSRGGVGPRGVSGEEREVHPAEASGAEGRRDGGEGSETDTERRQHQRSQFGAAQQESSAGDREGHPDGCAACSDSVPRALAH